MLKIGQLANHAGLTVRTLHHYDAIGLLRPSVRTDAGYRLYDRDDVALARWGDLGARPGHGEAVIMMVQPRFDQLVSLPIRFERSRRRLVIRREPRGAIPGEDGDLVLGQEPLPDEVHAGAHVPPGPDLPAAAEHEEKGPPCRRCQRRRIQRPAQAHQHLQTITVKHLDVVGLMPGLTMPFRSYNSAACGMVGIRQLISSLRSGRDFTCGIGSS